MKRSQFWVLVVFQKYALDERSLFICYCVVPVVGRHMGTQGVAYDGGGQSQRHTLGTSSQSPG